MLTVTLLDNSSETANPCAGICFVIHSLKLGY